MHQHDLLTLAAGDALVLAMEISRGLLPLGVTRPLWPWEVQSKTDFLAIDTTVRTAQDAAAAQLDEVRDAILAALTVALAGLGNDPALIAAAVQRFIAAQPPQVRAAITAAQEAIAAILEETYGAGAAELLDSAIAQGVEPPPEDAAKPDPPDFHAEAASGPSSVWAAVIGTLVAVGGSRPGTVTDLINAVRGTSLKPSQQLARQAVNLIYSQGRKAGLDQAPTPTEVYASEILDGSTCLPCSHVDGKSYDSLAAAYEDYPNGGQYKDCLGGDRCRGTVVAVFGESN